MKTVLAIACGGALGSVLRHFVNEGVTRLAGTGFPWGILAVNVAGSFIMGVLVSLFAHLWQPSQAVRALLTVGILGGFTTFSTFSLDTAALLDRGDVPAATFYVGGSVVLSIMALYGGMILIRAIAA